MVTPPAKSAGDLDWLTAQGVTVERFNLAQRPQPFVGNDLVRVALELDGDAGRASARVAVTPWVPVRPVGQTGLRASIEASVSSTPTTGSSH